MISFVLLEELRGDGDDEVIITEIKYKFHCSHFGSSQGRATGSPTPHGYLAHNLCAFLDKEGSVTKLVDSVIILQIRFSIKNIS